MRQVSNETILDIAKSMCWKYRINQRDKYRFTDNGLLQFARAILAEATDSKAHVNMMTVCAYESGMASGLMSAQFLCEKIVDEYQIEYMKQSGQDCIDAIRKELDISQGSPSTP